jgi:membrane protein
VDTSSTVKKYLDRKIPLLKSIAINLGSDLKGERITVSAGHLAYVSLLSLVPVIMVFFMIMSAFPAFEPIKAEFEQFVFSNLALNSGDVVQNYITKFVDNASSMGFASILGLFVVALLLISNIDKTFNHLWKTKVQRPILH